MSGAYDSVRKAVADARSTDDLVEDDFAAWGEPTPDESPLDEETLDERASTQMGPPQSRRRDAN